MTEPSLRLLQNWMFDAVTTPGGLAEGLQLAKDRYGLTPQQVVRGNNLLTAEQRVEIYARGYLLRLLECLYAEFPVLRALCGEQIFDLFATSYIWSHPSTSPSLMDLGAGFAQFLRATQPSGTVPGDIASLPANLAELERARAVSARQMGIERDRTRLPFLSMDDLFRLSNDVFHVPDTVAVLSCDFQLLDLIAQADRGEKPLAPPAANPCLYAVSRSRYRVLIHPIKPWQRAFLQALGTDGTSLAQAVAQAASQTDCSVDSLWGQALLWIPAAYDSALLTMTPKP